MGKIIGLQFLAKQEPQKHICEVCGAEFTKKAELTKHMKDEHPDNPQGGAPGTPPET